MRVASSLSSSGGTAPSPRPAGPAVGPAPAASLAQSPQSCARWGGGGSARVTVMRRAWARSAASGVKLGSVFQMQHAAVGKGRNFCMVTTRVIAMCERRMYHESSESG